MASSYQTSGFMISIEDLEMLCKPARVVLIPLELEDTDHAKPSTPPRKTAGKKAISGNEDKSPRKKPTSVKNDKTPKTKRLMRLKYITPDNNIIYLPKPVVLNDEQAEKYGLNEYQQCHFCSATFLDSGDLKRHERIHIWKKFDPKDPVYQTIENVIKENQKKLDSVYEVEMLYQLRQDPTEQRQLKDSTSLVSVEGEHSAFTPASKPNGSDEEVRLEPTKNIVQQAQDVSAGNLLSVNSDKDCFWGEGSEENESMKIYSGKKNTTANKCVFCGVGFFHLLNLRKHLSQTHGNEESILNGTIQLPYAKKPQPRRTPIHKCSQCDMTYTKLSMFKCHEKTHLGKCKYYCAECKCAYNSAEGLRSHLRMHSGEKPFTCNVCGISFATRGPYKNHLRIHNGLTPYVCEICGESFKQDSALRYHKVTAHGEKRLKCSSCPEEFTRASHLRTHRVRAHSVPNIKKFKCNLCPAAFSKSWGLKCHTAAHSNERPFLCDICSLTFKTNSALKDHRLKHLQSFFQCTVCGVQIKTKKTYNKHLRVAHGIGKEVCDICGVATNNLLSHKRIHEIPAESLTCGQCSYVASIPSLLKEHVRKKHSYERPFACEVCGQRFTVKTYLTIHKRRHFDEKHYQCTQCPESYRSFVTLKKHKAIHERQCSSTNQSVSYNFEDIEEERINSDL